MAKATGKRSGPLGDRVGNGVRNGAGKGGANGVGDGVGKGGANGVGDGAGKGGANGVGDGVGRLRRARASPPAPARAANARRAGRAAARAAPGFRIRLAEPADADAVKRLRQQADAIHARLTPDYFRARPAEREVTTAAADRFSAILVADGPGGVCGYVAVKLVDTPRDPTVTPSRRAYVDTIVVDEPHRGRGLGTALMRQAADWARRREAVELVLTVWSDNQAAEAFYRRLGYEPLARILRRSTEPASPGADAGEETDGEASDEKGDEKGDEE